MTRPRAIFWAKAIKGCRANVHHENEARIRRGHAGMAQARCRLPERAGNRQGTACKALGMYTGVKEP